MIEQYETVFIASPVLSEAQMKEAVKKYVDYIVAKGGEFSVKTLMRSSVDTAKDALAQKFEAVFSLAGIDTTFTGGYSGWAPNPDPAIHAGLECGILSGAYPHWDMVSCGPTLMSPVK